jgi:DNA-binding protein H-NS
MAAKIALGSMSVEALLQVREKIDRELSSRLAKARKQLSEIETRIAPQRAETGPRTRRKAAAKYRGPKGETWSGRGLRPRWLMELIKRGRKIEEFAIGEDGRGRKKK